AAPAVPPVDAVVPAEADPLRTAPARRDPEPDARAAPVEHRRRLVEPAELASDPGATKPCFGSAPLERSRRECHLELGRRPPAVLERERDAFAHQRLGARRVADEERTLGRERRPRPAADRRRLVAYARAAQLPLQSIEQRAHVRSDAGP